MPPMMLVAHMADVRCRRINLVGLRSTVIALTPTGD